MTNKNVIYQVDSFTAVPFRGNPAGVMIVDKTMKTSRMQDIALEMNLSETAFIIPDGRDYKIRYFTPAAEVPLCGHATLASGHILYSLGMRKPGEEIIFKAKGGVLTITNENGWISMNFPSYPLKKVKTHKAFKKIVGFQPVEMYSSQYNWVIAVAKSDSDIIKAKPDLAALEVNGMGHLLITAASKGKGADFSLRCFAPALGVSEDPVTGSAHCALTPLWSVKTGKTALNSIQLSKRGGRLKTRFINGRVEIKGQAITVLKAELLV